MLVKTKFFNEIEYDESNILHFVDGIPGFNKLKKYALVNPEDGLDFRYLQSVDSQDVCFIVIPPALIVGNYDIEISDTAEKKLEITKPEDAELYVILSIPKDIRLMTANLKAPIIINRKNKKAVQEILEDDTFSLRERVLKESDASC